MATFSIQRLIFIGMLFMIGPLTSLANDGNNSGFRHLPGIYKMKAVSDTIPGTKKPEENAPADTKTEDKIKIKEVPKSRRQVKPLAVPTVPVKPIKIIKPKIIRRTIGSLIP